MKHITLMSVLALSGCFAPQITRIPGNLDTAAESSPIMINGQVSVMVSHHFDGLYFYNWGGALLKVKSFGYEFASATNDGADIIVTGSDGKQVDIQRFDSRLNAKESIQFDAPYTVFNTSLVLLSPTRWVMALETSETPGRYATRFMESLDSGRSWAPSGGRYPADKGYAAAPTLKYEAGTYTLYYTATEKLYKPVNGLTYGFKTYRVTSRDLKDFSSPQLILDPQGDEGINASDFDLMEVNGITYITYDVGTQKDVGHIRRAISLTL